MKKLFKLSTLLIAMAMLFNFVACSSFGSVKKALEKAGYELVEDEDSSAVAKDAEDDERVTNIHVFSNKNSLSLTQIAKLTVVVVIEFKATKDLVEFYKENDTIKGIVSDIKEDGTADEVYNALKEAGLVHKNCIVAPIGLDAETVLNAIKEL